MKIMNTVFTDHLGVETRSSFQSQCHAIETLAMQPRHAAEEPNSVGVSRGVMTPTQVYPVPPPPNRSSDVTAAGSSGAYQWSRHQAAAWWSGGANSVGGADTERSVQVELIGGADTKQQLGGQVEPTTTGGADIEQSGQVEPFVGGGADSGSSGQQLTREHRQ